MSRQARRLSGDKASITRLVHTALDLIAPTAPRDWLLRLSWTGQSTRRALKELRAQGHGASSREVMRSRERYGLAARLWWVTMIVGSGLALSGAALLLPPRRSVGMTLEDALSVAPVPMVAGAVVLAILALPPVPGEVREAHNGRAVAIITGALTLIALIYHLMRLTQLGELNLEQTRTWVTAAALTLVPAGVLTFRTRLRPPRTRSHWREAAREARTHARWLQQHTPEPAADPALTQEWERAVARLAPELDADVIAQATRLGPWLFLVAAYHDGEVEVPRVPLPWPS